MGCHFLLQDERFQILTLVLVFVLFLYFSKILNVLKVSSYCLIMSKDTNDLLLFSNFHFSDKMFPAFGFGAQVPPQWQVGRTHCEGLPPSKAKQASSVLLSSFDRFLMNFQ